MILSLYLVVDMDNELVQKGQRANELYRVFASSGFNAIVAHCRDNGTRNRLSAYPVRDWSDYQDGVCRVIGKELFWSDGASLRVSVPVCEVEQMEFPF